MHLYIGYCVTVAYIRKFLAFFFNFHVIVETLVYAKWAQVPMKLFLLLVWIIICSLKQDAIRSGFYVRNWNKLWLTSVKYLTAEKQLICDIITAQIFLSSLFPVNQITLKLALMVNNLHVCTGHQFWNVGNTMLPLCVSVGVSMLESKQKLPTVPFLQSVKIMYVW